MTLPQKTLGRTGHSATRLGLGGEGVLRTFGHDRQAQAVIEAALAAGINYFETARAYSGSEAYLGRGLKGHRDQIFLTSKSHGRTFKEAMAHLSITLKNLDTDHLDLWQVHDIRTMEEVEALGAPGGALEAFHHARERGWVRFIGVTGHHDPEVLRRALTLYEFDTVLLPVNPAEPQQASFLPLAQEAMAKGMGVIAMKTLCRGQLPANGGRARPAGQGTAGLCPEPVRHPGGGGGGLRQAGGAAGRGGPGLRAHDPGGAAPPGRGRGPVCPAVDVL